MFSYDYTTLMIVSQALRFKILYQYERRREEIEESNLLNYITVAHPKVHVQSEQYISNV